MERQFKTAVPGGAERVAELMTKPIARLSAEVSAVIGQSKDPGSWLSWPDFHEQLEKHRQYLDLYPAAVRGGKYSLVACQQRYREYLQLLLLYYGLGWSVRKIVAQCGFGFDIGLALIKAAPTDRFLFGHKLNSRPCRVEITNDNYPDFIKIVAATFAQLSRTTWNRKNGEIPAFFIMDEARVKNYAAWVTNLTHGPSVLRRRPDGTYRIQIDNYALRYKIKKITHNYTQIPLELLFKEEDKILFIKTFFTYYHPIRLFFNVEHYLNCTFTLPVVESLQRDFLTILYDLNLYPSLKHGQVRICDIFSLRRLAELQVLSPLKQTKLQKYLSKRPGKMKQNPLVAYRTFKNLIETKGPLPNKTLAKLMRQADPPCYTSPLIIARWKAGQVDEKIRLWEQLTTQSALKRLPTPVNLLGVDLDQWRVTPSLANTKFLASLATARQRLSTCFAELVHVAPRGLLRHLRTICAQLRRLEAQKREGQMKSYLNKIINNAQQHNNEFLKLEKTVEALFRSRGVSKSKLFHNLSQIKKLLSVIPFRPYFIRKVLDETTVRSARAGYQVVHKTIEEALFKVDAITEELLEKNKPLAKYIVNRYYQQLRPDLKNDLDSCALTGLWRAIETYLPGMGVQFSTYAAQCILNGLRYEAKMQKMDYLVPGQPVPVSLATPVTNDGDVTLADTIAVEVDFEADMQVQQLRTMVRQSITEMKISEKNKQILVMRYDLNGEGARSFQEIGARLGLSRQRVAQVEKRFRDQIRRKLAAVLSIK